MAGPSLVILDGMDREAIDHIFTVPEAFVSMCEIVKEDSSTGPLEPTPAQVQVIRALEKHPWLFVNKYRQAKISTVTMMHLLLRDCMYFQGILGILLAERNKTAEMLFQRLRFAYEKLPAPLKMPLEAGRTGSRRELRFVHGGHIIIDSLESGSPAVGMSPDRLHVSEFGEAKHQRDAVISLFPGIRKRPHAKFVLESTPGRAGSYHESMWHAALRGNSKFHPLFLEWWKDDSAKTEVPDGFVPTEDELTYLGDHPGMTMQHLAYMREALNTDFLEQRLFDAKFPPDPYAGWLGSLNPTMPEDVIRVLLGSSQNDPSCGSHGVGEFCAPIKGHTYAVFADPTGFGADGDPAAMTVFDLDTLEEVAVWAGHEAPDKFAYRVYLVCAHYNNALAVVESNHAGCITALRDLNVKMHYSKRTPGWYATSKSISQGEFGLVKLLRDRKITIRSRQGLEQLLRYDGDFSRRERGSDGEGHHFDRARTYVMAGDILTQANRRLEWRAKHADEDNIDYEAEQAAIERGEMPLRLFDAKRDNMGGKRRESATRIPKLR